MVEQVQTVVNDAERLMRLEVQQEANMRAIEQLSHLVERLTRVEERQQSLSRIVYGAIGVLVSIEVIGITYVLQRMTGG